MLTAPCKDCPDRYPKCHTECEKYIEFRKNRDEYLKKKKDAKYKEWVLHRPMKRRGW